MYLHDAAPQSLGFNIMGAVKKIGRVMKDISRGEHKIGKVGVALINPLKFVHEKVTEEWAINHVHHQAYIHAMKYWPPWAKKNIRWIFPTAFRHRKAHGYVGDTPKGPKPVAAAQADKLWVHDDVSRSWIPVGDVQAAAADGEPAAQDLKHKLEQGLAPTATESVLRSTGQLEKATPETVTQANQAAQDLPPPSPAAERGAEAAPEKKGRGLAYAAGAFVILKALAVL